jgi:hypothetical protein
MKKGKVETGDNMKRTVAVVCVTLLIAACNRTPQQQPARVQLPIESPAVAATTPPPIKVKLDCKNKDSGTATCKAYNSLQNAFADLQGFSGTLALELVAPKEHGKEALALANRGLAALDAATAEINDPNIKSMASQLHTSYLSCENKIYSYSKAHPKGIMDDSFHSDEIADSCAFGVQRQAAAIGVSLGVYIDPIQSDIFGMTWGISMSDALNINARITGRDAEHLFYRSTVDSKQTTVILNFTNDQLAQVFYNILAEHSDDQAYLSDFSSIDDLLKDKYKSPSSSGPQWADDLYKNRPSDWGMALASGRMQMRSEWQTPRTNITHAMVGDNFKITHGIIYTSRELTAAMKQAAREKGKSQL